MRWLASLRPTQKLYLVIAIVLILNYFVLGNRVEEEGSSPPSVAEGSALREAFDEQRVNYQIAGNGVVTRILSDDNDGSRHQRFVLEIEPELTVLVAHNIDLAPRIEPIAIGDEVAFFGEYEWNAQGGVIHWTHHDPDGEHVGGWLEHGGRRYE
jgi:molybdopterin converting factor small subunit